MGLLGSLMMLLLTVLLFCSLKVVVVTAQPNSTGEARGLDALLQDYAYQAFVRPKTGVIYDGVVPSNLTGIRVSAMRLRSGSLRKHGYSMYKEFHIPVGIVEKPYVKRLALVYQNLGNWSLVYYPLPGGYMYLAPVLGLLAYDASDLMAKNLPELDDIHASGQPMSINFSGIGPLPEGPVPKCVSFDLNGTVNFNDISPDRTCTTFQQGHFSIVVESTAPPPPAPGSPRPGPPGPGGGPVPSGQGKKNNSKTWIIVGSVLGGSALLVMLGLLVLWGFKYKKIKKMQHMERAAEVGESLEMTRVGSTKAPSATGTRTQPILETDYVP